MGKVGVGPSNRRQQGHVSRHAGGERHERLHAPGVAQHRSAGAPSGCSPACRPGSGSGAAHRLEKVSSVALMLLTIPQALMPTTASAVAVSSSFRRKGGRAQRRCRQPFCAGAA